MVYLDWAPAGDKFAAAALMIASADRPTSG